VGLYGRIILTDILLIDVSIWKPEGVKQECVCFAVMKQGANGMTAQDGKEEGKRSSAALVLLFGGET
jgi:hypothetical protein